MKMKSKAQLFRDLKAKKISLELIERFGDTDFPEKLKGLREVCKVNTVGCKLINSSGEESYLDIPRANLVDYTDDELIIYNPGHRELNDKEKEILSDWNDIANGSDFVDRAMYDALSDGSSTYWQQKHFFEDRGALYLMQDDGSGKRIDYNKTNEGNPKCLVDPAVRGERILVYKVIQN